MGILGSLGVLLDTALSLYTWLIVIRILLSWVNPDPYNPVVQFLVRATEPVLAPLRRLIPPIAGLDLSPVAALFGISRVQRLLVGLVQGGMGGGAVLRLLSELLGFLHLLLTFYLLVLIVRGGLHVHAWLTFRRSTPFRVDLNHGFVRFVFQSTEPVVRRLRRWVPTFSGMDMTPMAAALGLVFLLSLLQDLSVSLVSP